LTDHDTLLAAVIRLAARHHVPGGDVHEVPGGVANHAFAMGPHCFVRVARGGYEADLDKETIVVPPARAAGVRTPAIVDYDDSCSLVPAPYLVMERVHGVEPVAAPLEIATDLARLHSAFQTPVVSRLDDRGPDLEKQPGGIPTGGWGDPHQTVTALAADGWVDLGTADWLTGWIERLEARIDRSAPNVLIHGDVAPHNLLVDPGDGSLTALIDWGDAAWAPRATEFAKLRLSEVAAIVPRYLATTGPACDADELAAGIVYLQLSWALSKLTTPAWIGQRHWTAPPASRLVNLLQFFTTNPPEPWSRLT
jgi:hygromycin-B 7''-O-kinase